MEKDRGGTECGVTDPYGTENHTRAKGGCPSQGFGKDVSED